MCANTAPAPVVLGPTPPALTHLSPHCPRLTSPATAMPAIASVPLASPDAVLRNSDVTHGKTAQSFQQRKPSDSLNDNSDFKTSTTTQTTTTFATPSPKLQAKDSPKKATPITCEGCSQPHDGSYGSGRFCSVHCARRIAASRKWEKQRSQRKRAAAAAAAAATSAAVDHSTSSLSSASSDDPVTQKRQRVVVMQGMIPVPHVVHHPNLVHPQPQHFQRPLAFSGMRPHPYSAAASPLSGTPTPPPLPALHHSPTPYMDYGSVTPRAVTPVQYHNRYYPYQTSSVPYTSTPPSYAVYPSPSPRHIPPPPPPTPAQDVLNRGNVPAVPSYTSTPPFFPVPKQKVENQGLVSSERECEAVAEALLFLRTSSNAD